MAAPCWRVKATFAFSRRTFRSFPLTWLKNAWWKKKTALNVKPLSRAARPFCACSGTWPVASANCRRHRWKARAAASGRPQTLRKALKKCCVPAWLILKGRNSTPCGAPWARGCLTCPICPCNCWWPGARCRHTTISGWTALALPPATTGGRRTAMKWTRWFAPPKAAKCPMRRFLRLPRRRRACATMPPRPSLLPPRRPPCFLSPARCPKVPCPLSA